MNSTPSSERGPSRRATAGLIVAAWCALGLLSTVDAYALNLVEGVPVPFPSVLLRQMPRWLLWAVMTPLVLWLGRRVPFQRRPPWVPIVFHALAGTAVGLVHSSLTFAMFLPFLPAMAPDQPLASLFARFMASQLHFALLGYAAILGAGFAVEYHRRLVARDLREARLEAQLVQARLQALQNRLHPHFLFNTLHAASVLIDDRPADARRVLSRLGDLLRDLLERTDVTEIPLREELELLRPYLEVQEIRFHDRLDIDLDIDPTVEAALVPSFLLQPLVENAVGHGIGAQAGSGSVRIEARPDGDELALDVSNTHGGRRPPSPEAWPAGIGLSATRERLDKLYAGEASLDIEVDDERTNVSVRLPWTRYTRAEVGDV